MGHSRTVLLVTTLLALFAAGCGSTEPSTEGTDPTTPVQAGDEVVRAEPDTTGAPIGALADSLTELGFDLLRREDATANTVLSPTSIAHAVLMARAAADSTTVEAIQQHLGLPAGMAGHDAWNAVDQLIAASNGTGQGLDDLPTPIVTIADRVWPSQTAQPDQEWLDLLSSHHGADVETIDTTRPAESRDRVNTWVSDQTDGLIPELLPEGFIDGDTALILTDAIYFKAQWKNVFGKYGEELREFRRLDDTVVEVPLLRDLEQGGSRGGGDGYVGAEIPYVGDDYSMLLIVPEQGRYHEVRDRLGSGLLGEIDDTFTAGPYELLMPRWKTTSSIDLLPWLTDIGAAPGSYPSISPGAFLDGGVHGADIAVDEIGTVAAAATALGFDESGPPEPEFTVAADKPFFYVIRHLETGTALFVGQVTDPTA